MTQTPFAAHSSSPTELKARISAERRGHPFLLYRDGGDRQQIIKLDEAPDVVTIGRRPTSELPLPWDAGVSRLHAQLERLGGDWTVSDEGLSRNGTFVNGLRVTGRRRLIDGDVLRFGDTVIAYCDPEHRESRATVDQDDVPTLSSVSVAQRRVLLALCRPYSEPGGFASPASNKQIATELCVSVDTVKKHMRALFDIFQVGEFPQNQKRAHLVERAFHAGLVTDRDL